MKEQLSKLIKNPVSASSIVGVVTFGAGVGVGYILGRRKKYEIFEPPPRVGLVLDANELAELEANDHNSEHIDDESEEDQDKDNIEGPIGSGGSHESLGPVSARDFIEQKLNEDIVIEIEDETDDTPVPNNIFASNDDDWDYEIELSNRTPTTPYVIHKDEFYNDERGFHQSTLTWYAGDEMMVDQEDQPIYNYGEVIGPLKFGHGSGDPNIFHVRNEKTRSEWEILFDPGYFKVAVLGYEIEDDAQAQDVKHSQGLRRFQMD